MNSLHIGFFDSGIGGIAYLQRFQEMSAHDTNHTVFYVADNGGFPYGEKTNAYLIERMLFLSTTFIAKKQLDILVIACNTTSVLVLDTLRAIPTIQKTAIVGVVPAIKTAVEKKHKKVFVMSTKSTAETASVIDIANNAKEKFGFDSKVVLHPCQTLVQAIESMMTNKNDKYEIFMLTELQKIINEIIASDSQAVVLGCTHYLHIKTYIRDLLPSHIEIIDSLEGVSNQIMALTKKIQKETLCLPAHSNDAFLPKFFLTKKENEPQYKYICEKFHLDFQGIL